MSAGWEIGDLAMCLDDGRCSKCGHQTFDPRRAYAVCGVWEASAPVWLIFDLPNCCVGDCWDSSTFRKIRPDEQEPCEAEFVTLLKRSKNRVSA